jgi:hypothetical protein
MTCVARRMLLTLESGQELAPSYGQEWERISRTARLGFVDLFWQGAWTLAEIFRIKMMGRPSSAKSATALSNGLLHAVHTPNEYLV